MARPPYACRWRQFLSQTDGGIRVPAELQEQEKALQIIETHQVTKHGYNLDFYTTL
jgi:hypothetical protein